MLFRGSSEEDTARTQKEVGRRDVERAALETVQRFVHVKLVDMAMRQADEAICSLPEKHQSMRLAPREEARAAAEKDYSPAPAPVNHSNPTPKPKFKARDPSLTVVSDASLMDLLEAGSREPRGHSTSGNATHDTGDAKQCSAVPRPVSAGRPQHGIGDKVGIGLLLGNTKNGEGQDVEVCEIIPGFSAEESNQFDVGDRVLIDGIRVHQEAGIPLKEVRRLTMGEVGEEVILIMRSVSEVSTFVDQPPCLVFMILPRVGDTCVPVKMYKLTALSKTLLFMFSYMSLFLPPTLSYSQTSLCHDFF